MQELHIHPNLLGAKIKNSQRTLTIIASWMEEPTTASMRPQFTVLGVSGDGTCLKVQLPNEEWEVQMPFFNQRSQT